MDHNFDMAQTFAKPLLDDPRIKKITHMVAYHDYRGRPEEMALLSRQHPEFRPSSASIPMAPSGSSAA